MGARILYASSRERDKFTDSQWAEYEAALRVQSDERQLAYDTTPERLQERITELERQVGTLIQIVGKLASPKT